MPTTFKLPDDAAVEKSTFVIEVAFKDEDGQPVQPNSATYTLTDEAGAIINSIDDAVISPLATIVEIVLKGDDLELSDGFVGNAEWRVLLIEALYNSDLGTGLPLNDFCKFPVVNAIAITNT